MAGSVALLLCVPRHLSLHRHHGLRRISTAMAATGALEQMVTAHLGPVMLWLAIGVLAGFAVKVPLMPFHTWLPAAYAEAPSPVTMLLTGAMSKMGVYGLLRIALPHLRAADRADAHAASGSRRRHRRDGRMGRGRAKRFEARLRLLLGESPRLLPARHLRAGRSRYRAQQRKPARPPRSTASSCRCSTTALPRPRSSGSSP